MTEGVDPDDPLAPAGPARWWTGAAERAAAAKVHRGRSITFESVPAANRHVLTKQYIFNSDVGTREVATLAPTVGRFVDRCN